jgi:homocysteine S-methyltransferase
MPNAGLPQNVSGASLYSVTPADMADFARKAVQAGATLIGGCCGTTPAHIRAMKAALSAMHSR